ncbi:MAG: oligosaccharide flippase family protein, partial [Deltaproteobacteria bacterium]
LVPQAFPLMLNNLLSAVFFRFDMFIVRGFGGARADTLVQQYALPYQLLNIALVLPPAVTFAVFPLLARRAAGDRAAMADAQRRTLQLLLLIAFPLAVGMCVLSSDLVWVFARRNFAAYLPSDNFEIPILGIAISAKRTDRFDDSGQRLYRSSVAFVMRDSDSARIYRPSLKFAWFALSRAFIGDNEKTSKEAEARFALDGDSYAAKDLLIPSSTYASLFSISSARNRQPETE